MNSTFNALWATAPDENPDNFKQMQCSYRSTTLAELTVGDVTIKTEYSGVNYKDALALTGRGKILRQLPLIPGIDAAGRVLQSKTPLFKEGDRVLINGANLGEKLCGGYSEILQVPHSILIKCPDTLSTREAMIYGTAGFTAALALHKMEQNDLSPNKGTILVTGASGGVGSLATQFLKTLGYTVEAWTRSEKKLPWLKSCGADKVAITPEDLQESQGLVKSQWAGAIDNLGGETLQHILPRIQLWGSVASIGLAQSAKLNSTVFPFILRGVNLLGISSNNCPQDLRQILWNKMATTMKPKDLEAMVSDEISLKELSQYAPKIINSEHNGRIIVRIK